MAPRMPAQPPPTFRSQIYELAEITQIKPAPDPRAYHQLQKYVVYAQMRRPIATPDIICQRCKHVWVARTHTPRACPACRSVLWNFSTRIKSTPRMCRRRFHVVALLRFSCKRCSVVWVARTSDPKQCPRCRTRSGFGPLHRHLYEYFEEDDVEELEG